MDREHALAACSRQDAAQLTYPFGETTAVFKIGGKMFAAVSLGDLPGRITLKCDPGYAAALVDQYDGIVPGYHMNKRHWITVALHPSPPATLLEDLIADSYDLVRSTLPARSRTFSEELPGP
ncbi:MAG: MmcQ/YjbR family DNA-binding protein [Candidatus Dormibacteria bacterium]